jgi:menaquinone reductase, molybdopterin-binding-like subunit
VTPLYNTRATADVIFDLAHRFGEPVARAFPWHEARDAFEQRWLGLHAAARGTIVEASPKQFLERLEKAGFWAEIEDAPISRVHVRLPSGWSEPRWEGEPARYPLALVAYHPLGHSEGGGANQPWLRNLYPRPGQGPWMFAASLSPTDAPTGVHSGDRIRVVSPYGSLELAVHIDPRITPGCIAIPTGGGHRAFGKWARGFGVNVMELLPAAAASDTGASLICTTRVRVEVVA